MFARNVSLHLKPNSVGEFARLIEKEIIPLLRKQNGFQDEIIFIASGGLNAVGISLWNEKEDAETYSHKIFPRVMKALARVVEGTPQVQTYEVSNSTFHKINFSAIA
jgi:hypothetical protein